MQHEARVLLCKYLVLIVLNEYHNIVGPVFMNHLLHSYGSHLLIFAVVSDKKILQKLRPKILITPPSVLN